MKSKSFFALTAVFALIAVLVTGAKSREGSVEPMGLKAKVAGSWSFTITQTDGEIYPFHITFDQGGGLIASCDTMFLAPLHGNWEVTANHQVALSFEAEVFDPATDNPGGIFKGSMSLSLGDPEGSLGGNISFTGADPNGNPIDELTATGSITGSRVAIQPLP
ncbi:MAG TPA: hypothetical protein VLZ81_11220 [Blastocatellia bacterium]|nr:hypothetical protein [Blastocatellia bacterium]